MTAVLEPGDQLISTEVVRDDFDGFFITHHDVIVRALSVALGDDQFGRDAAAEGFTRALQRWGRVSRFDNPSGWVYRVGLNWARSRRRKSRREVLNAPVLGDVAAPTRTDIDPRITPALGRLSDDHRAVIVARFYLDWSETEIAEALSIRPGTVKSRLSRAISQLSADLGTA